MSYYRMEVYDKHDNLLLVRESKVRATSQRARIDTLERWAHNTLRDMPEAHTIITKIVEEQGYG